VKTATASISAATLTAFLTAFAMVPLPTFPGSPTGLKFVYQVMAAKHIAGMTEWVANISNNHAEQSINKDDIKSREFYIYLHGAGKPKRYDYDDIEDYRDAVDDWRDHRDRLEDELKDLKLDGKTLESSRVQMLAKSPIKAFLKLE